MLKLKLKTIKKRLKKLGKEIIFIVWITIFILLALTTSGVREARAIFGAGDIVEDVLGFGQRAAQFIQTQAQWIREETIAIKAEIDRARALYMQAMEFINFVQDTINLPVELVTSVINDVEKIRATTNRFLKQINQQGFTLSTVPEILNAYGNSFGQSRQSVEHALRNSTRIEDGIKHFAKEYEKWQETTKEAAVNAQVAVNAAIQTTTGAQAEQVAQQLHSLVKDSKIGQHRALIASATILEAIHGELVKLNSVVATATNLYLQETNYSRAERERAHEVNKAKTSSMPRVENVDSLSDPKLY